MADDKQSEVTLGLVYDGLQESPIFFGNQFLIQYQQDEFILTICQVSPPLLIGTPEQQLEQAKQIKNVHSKVLVRVGMTAARLAELADLLQTQVANFQNSKMKGPMDVH